MTLTALLIIFIVLAMIISGITILKRTANKFDLPEETLKKIKERNQAIDKQEKSEDDY